MRIGLFTETYRPAINGIVFVVESTKRHLESLGHEVYIFCPARSIRPSKHAIEFDEDEHIIRFPSVQGAFYEDYDLSFFFPPRAVRMIRSLELDVIHFFTPAQIGMLGVYAAFKNDIPLVAQHSTDLYQYVEHYPATLPGVLALGALLPFTIKIEGKDLRELLKLYRPRRERVTWSREIVEKAITLIYSKCDAVIALSRKSRAQLEGWQHEDRHTYELTMLPNGVDALPKPKKAELEAFRKQWGITLKDEVMTFVGRLGAEKNLAMLIPTLEHVLKKRPRAKLMFVGDFEYRETLEELARNCSAPDRVIFTGSMKREKLGVAYGASRVFVFPSVMDTQGWVVHEAAHAGLPMVLIDRELSEVLEDGKNGYFADNDPRDFADKVVAIMSSRKYKAMAAYGKKLASKYTEKRYIKKLEAVYKKAIKNHAAHPRVKAQEVETIAEVE
ncbi:glycosyltransferase [Candidatus Saccharibacteria bacterium]|nr:MAG: glycosyltransferase [Candidatus Saccharibacteria bacterium]